MLTSPLPISTTTNQKIKNHRVTIFNIIDRSTRYFSKMLIVFLMFSFLILMSNWKRSLLFLFWKQIKWGKRRCANSFYLHQVSKIWEAVLISYFQMWEEEFKFPDYYQGSEIYVTSLNSHQANSIYVTGGWPADRTGLTELCCISVGISTSEWSL